MTKKDEEVNNEPDDDDNNNNEDDDDEEEEEVADVAAMLDLSKKKKKKKKKEKSSTSAAGGGSSGGTTSAATTTTTATTVSTGLSDELVGQQQTRLLELDQAQELDDPDDRQAAYTYQELLERVVSLLQVNNPDLVEKKRTRIKPPQLQLMSSKKTLWVNFQEICSMMQRDPQHVYAFFMAELGTEGSIDGNQRLIIRGKYVAKYIESLLRKYVLEYVTCEMCRSPNTDLVKDAASRLYFCTCRECGSSRSVAPIRSGYHATSRADRRAARNAKAN